MTSFDFWDKQAHTYWQQNKRSLAIKRVFDAINKQKNCRDKNYHYYAQVGVYLFTTNDFQSATQMMEYAVEQIPDNLEILQNYVICLAKIGEFEKSVAFSKKYLNKNSDSPMIYDSLSRVYHRLGDLKNAKLSGTKSLTLKHNMVMAKGKTDAQILKNIQQKGVSGANNYLSNQPNRTKKVISFSLYGNNARYLHGAIRNLSLIPDIYPEWEAWIYLDDSVPKSYQSLYRAMGAKLIKMPNDCSLRQKLTWRFLIANEPTVARFLIRDIDSVINIRERQAVDKWISEDKLFHVMRDWWTHTELILAGMWGGVAGLLPDIKTTVNSFENNRLENRHIDQYILRYCVWGYIITSLSQHDRLFNLDIKKVLSSNPWQGYKPTFNKDDIDIRSIGSCEASLSNHFQLKMIKPWLLLMKQLEDNQPRQNKVEIASNSNVKTTIMTGKLPITSIKHSKI